MRRFRAVLLLLILLFHAGSAFAAKPTATPLPYITPTLDPNFAIEYDPKTPEKLYPEQLWSWSAIVIEAETGNVIFEKDADAVRYPASTTKIMTTLLALIMTPEDQLNQTVVCSERAVAVTEQEENVTSLKLQAGEEISLRDLLYATMIYSANDGANVIAEAVGGSIEHFVDMMNETALTFGCTSTHFTNPHGLHDDWHYTTARDLAIITRYAMQNEIFRDIVSPKSSPYQIPKTNMHRARSVTSTNELYLPGTAEKPNRYYYPDAIGVKTGYTTSSQYCFVGSAERDGVRLISVVMYAGDNSRWRDTILLLNYGFSQYTSFNPVELYNENPIELQISGYSLSDADNGRLSLSCLPADEEASQARIITTYSDKEYQEKHLREIVLIDYQRDFSAPVQAGETMGTMTYLLDSGEPVTYNLVANRSIAKRENVPRSIDAIYQQSDDDPNPLPPFSFEMLLLILLPLGAAIGLYILLYKLLFGRKKKGGRSPSVKQRYLR